MSGFPDIEEPHGRKSHILVFEPRMGGHHLSWLGFVTHDLLAEGFELTLAVDLRPGSRDMIIDYLSNVLPDINLMSAYNGSGRYLAGTKVRTLAACFQKSGAREILMTNFDEIAPNCMRLAGIGIDPPAVLHGKISGVYFRPRFMAGGSLMSTGNFLKERGFKRLCRNGWFKNIYLLDEYLAEGANERYSGARFHFLPDPWSGNFSIDLQTARRELQIPSDAFVFLNYGIGTRRKGLHLLVSALRRPPLPGKGFLLSAGKIADDRELLNGTAELEKKGIARILNRYVSNAEEELCFAACDVVLLPYVHHFGSSGVLSRAAAAGKMVIASDEELLAKRVRQHRLGLLFRSEDVGSLRDKMEQACLFDESVLSEYREAALRYAESCSRRKFRDVLVGSFRGSGRNPLSDKQIMTD